MQVRDILCRVQMEFVRRFSADGGCLVGLFSAHGLRFFIYN